MNKRSYRDILDSAARNSLSHNADLWPKISARFERKSFMTTLRTRPAMAVLITLIVLLTLSGVAYAIGRSLGYVPGVGVVDQNTPFRAIAEPISQTRDGVTVTIEKAVVNADKLLLVYKVEGLTPDKFSFLEPLNTCFQPDEIRLSDGSSAKIIGGSGSNPMDAGYESTATFGPLPTGVMDAVLFLPCINGALAPGILPENWEIPMHFVPVAPEAVLTIMPVIEVPTSTPAAPAIMSTDIAPSPSDPVENLEPLSLLRVIDAGGSYILVGNAKHPTPSQPGGLMQSLDWKLTDGNGQLLDYQIPSDDLGLGDRTLLSDPNLWAFQISKGFVPPLHITHRYREAIPANSPDKFVFQFDAGAPQDQQAWDFAQDFSLAGHPLRLVRITAENIPTPYDGSPSRYAFWFDLRTSDMAVNGVKISVEGYTSNPTDPRNNYPNNYAPEDPMLGQMSYYLSWPQLPSGILDVIFSDLYLNGDITSWTLDWQP